jgi:hypothetical protein
MVVHSDFDLDAEGERSERQNAVNNQSRRDRHVVTPEVVYLGYVLGERQVRLL